MGSEIGRAKLWLIAGVLFCTAGYASCTEFKYALRGEQAEATVVKVRKTREIRRHGQGREVLDVTFTFAEADGAERRETLHRPLDWTPPPDNLVAVQYLPGKKWQVRFASDRHYWPIVLFCACLAYFVALFIWLSRQAYR